MAGKNSVPNCRSPDSGLIYLYALGVFVVNYSLLFAQKVNAGEFTDKLRADA